MRPRATQLSAQTLRRRLPSLFRSSDFLLRPLPRPQTSPPNAAHRSHRFASMSSASNPTPTSADGQQPLAIGTQLKSSLGKCYTIDKVLSERPAAGRLWCVYRATKVDPFPSICPVHAQRTESLNYLPISGTKGSSSLSRTSSQATSTTSSNFRSTSNTLPMSGHPWTAFPNGIFSSSPS